MTQRPTVAGYSLVELMIVLVVLSVGILAIAKLLPSASREQVRDRLRTAGSYYAQEKIETLRTLAFSAQDLTTGRHPSDTTNETVGPKSTYRRYWTVAPLVDPLQNITRVDVVVAWNASHGPDSVVATTYITY